MKRIIFLTVGLIAGATAHSISQGEINFKEDSILFQNKCSSCHSPGLISHSDEVLPSEVWSLVERMARTDGANIYCPDERERIYTYIVNYNSRNRSKEIEKALNCIPEIYREGEKLAIENAKARYKK